MCMMEKSHSSERMGDIDFYDVFMLIVINR